MSTRAEKLRSKRAEQAKANAAHKAAREKQKKIAETPEELNKRLSQLETEYKKTQDEFELLRKNAEDVGISYAPNRDGTHGCHFRGNGSTHYNQIKTTLDAKTSSIASSIERIRDKLDPERVKIQQESKERARRQMAIWSAFMALESKVERRKTEPSPQKYVIQRKRVSLILAKETPIRCYHLTPDGYYENCDCTRGSNETFTLSEKYQELYRLGKLEIDEEALKVQNMVVADGSITPNFFGGPLDKFRY